VTYTVERIHWCNRLQQSVLFRLTYLRTWIAERELWSDFLVGAEELENPQELSSNRAEASIAGTPASGSPIQAKCEDEAGENLASERHAPLLAV